MEAIRCTQAVSDAIDLLLAQLPADTQNICPNDAEYDWASETRCDECSHVGLFASSRYYARRRRVWFICPECGDFREVKAIIAR